MKVWTPHCKCVIHDVEFPVADYQAHCEEFHDGNPITVQPLLAPRPETST